jgi:general secretion pathway protein D
MKKLILTLMALGAAGLMASALAQTETNAPDVNPGQPGEAGAPYGTPGGPNGGPPEGVTPPEIGGQPTPDQSAPPDNNSGSSGSGGNTAIVPTKPFSASPAPITSTYLPPAGGTNSDQIRLNFRNAPLEMVLNYLSDAAGFIIVLDTPVSGNITVISGQPMTKDEAVDLLNSVLNQNGYAAIRDGRTLTIVDKNDAKTRDIPVKVSNDPDSIPKNDEIVTQVIPIRFVDAGDLVKDLSSFVSPQATVVANDAGNSIVITDTQSNIRHIVEIIKAIDSSAEAETEIRVFHLQFASPTDVANELGSVFPSANGSGTGSQAPIRFGGGGRGGGPGGFFQRMMAASAPAGGDSSDRIKKATQVTAVADSRIQAVIVTAPKDLMSEIADMMHDLDVPSTRDQNVYVYHMNNGDPQQALQVLQSMFQSTSTSRGSSSSSSSSQTSPLQQRAQNMSTSTSSSGTTAGSGFTGSGGSGGRGGSGGAGF